MAIPSTQIAAVVSASAAAVEISRTHPVPTPGNGELLVKLEFSGVCHSDLHSIRGDTPMLTDVAGHEGVGKVVAGEKTPLSACLKEIFQEIVRLNAVASRCWC